MYSCFDLTACRHWWMCCWKSVWKWNLQECNRRFWMHLRWGIWAWTNDDLWRWDSHVSPGLSLQLCAKTVPWFRKQLRRAKQLEKKNYGLLEQCIVSWNRKIGFSFLIPLELWYLFLEVGWTGFPAVSAKGLPGEARVGVRSFQSGPQKWCLLCECFAYLLDVPWAKRVTGDDENRKWPVWVC